MKSQRELENKWSELNSNLAFSNRAEWQSRSNYMWILAQKELLEWVLS